MGGIHDNVQFKELIRLKHVSETGQFIQNVYVRPSDIVAVFEQPVQNPGSTSVKLQYSALIRARVRTPDGGSANVHLILEESPLYPERAKNVHGFEFDKRRLGARPEQNDE